MKEIILLSVLSLSILACNEKPEEDYILFSGKIVNPVSKEIHLKSDISGKNKTTIILNEDGSFNDTIRSGSGLYDFSDSKNRMDVYLVNGGKIHLTYNGNDYRSTVKVSGKYSETSNYIFAKNKIVFDKLRDESDEFFGKTEPEFLKQVKSLTDNLNNLLDSFDNIPEVFLENERKELKYEYLFYLTQYEDGYKSYAEKPDFKVSDSFLSEFKDIDFNNEEDYKSSSTYRRLVPWHYEKQISELAKKGDDDISLTTMKVYAAIPNDYIRNDLFVLNTRTLIADTKKLDEFYQIFLSYSLPTKFSDEIKLQYEKLKKTAIGEPSPRFVDYINHAGGKTSLENLRGKYVYIDIWATWCAPCIREVPFLEKVIEEFHGKNIHFVSISIDNDKAFDKWKKMVTDKNMKGIQLIADDAWSSSFIDGYQLSGVPRFILLDPEGKIVAPHAPRPSDPDLVVLLKELTV